MISRAGVCVCGGGHIAHSLVAAVSEAEDVLCLTRRPERWSDRLECDRADAGFRPCAHRVAATSDPAAVAVARFVVVALPRFAIEEEMTRILPFLGSGQIVCFVPAPGDAARWRDVLAERGVACAGFQRVPFVSRTAEYGRSVRISAPRAVHRIAVSDPALEPELSAFCRRFLGGEASFLSSFLLFAFSNSNPLLHPARLVPLFRGWKSRTYGRIPLFYEEWTDESSVLYVAADRELRDVCSRFPEIDLDRDYVPVLRHYGVSSIPALTEKLRGIPGFKGIASPMVPGPGGFVPDLSSRYFTEDVPFGTVPIQRHARSRGVETPVIDFLVGEIARIRNPPESI